MEDVWTSLVRRHLIALCSCEYLGPAIQKTTTILRTCLDKGGKVIVCGNGGSAAHAQHLAAELVGRFKSPRPALASIALGCNPAITSAVLNDFGGEQYFLREFQAIASPGDVLIGISTSGRSPNVVRTMKYAAEEGFPTIALTGMAGMSSGALHEIRVPSDDTARVQEIHQLIVHALAEALD